MTRVQDWSASLAGQLSGARRREAEDFDALLRGDRVPDDVSSLVPLVTLARTLGPVGPAPGPEFRLALRERLLDEASRRPASAPVPRPHRASLRTAAATLAAASLVTGVGAAAASSRALPGDALYGLKRQIEVVELALTFSDLDRGRALLEQAEARLGEAERLATSDGASEAETERDIAGVLADWETAAVEGASALTLSYRDTGDSEPMLLLDRFVLEQRERLDALLLRVEPALRDRVRAALATLKVLGARSAAVLASASVDRAVEAAGAQGRAAGDGWAVSRLLDRGTSAAAGVTGQSDGLVVADGTGAAATTGNSPLADVTGGVAAPGSTTDSGATADSGALLSPGVTATSGPPLTSDPLLTSNPLGTASPLLTPAPLPTTALPLPTATSITSATSSIPLPTASVTTILTSSPLPSVSLTPLPLPSLSATCIPVPPLTTC